MIVAGFVGASGSGKTTLLTALIPILKGRGFSVSSIKHAHHDVALDRPGKDSFRHAQAGAEEVMLVSDAGSALFSRQPQPLLQLVRRLQPVDYVLVEGFKHDPIPKLEVFRPALGKPPLWPDVDMAAIVSDAPVPAAPVPVLDLNAPAAIVDFLATILPLNERPNATE